MADVVVEHSINDVDRVARELVAALNWRDPEFSGSRMKRGNGEILKKEADEKNAESRSAAEANANANASASAIAWRRACAANPDFLSSRTFEGILRLGVLYRLCA